MTDASKVRFPPIRTEGPFTVRALFHTTFDAMVDLVRDYVEAWSRANRTWVRIWRSNTIEVERLDFCAEFSSDPRVDIDGAQRFAISFEGKALPGAKSSTRRWKDWIVRLVDSLSKVFPEIELKRFE
jgi:hypothetical protein